MTRTVDFPANAARVRGPRGLPLVGNLLPFMSDPLNFLRLLLERHGDVVEWDLGTSKALLVGHPEHVGEVLSQVESTFDFPDLGHAFRTLTGEGVATSRGADWKRKRATAMPAVRPQQVQAYADVMVNSTLAHVARWRPGDRVDVYTEIRDLTRTIAVRAIFGSDPQGEGGDIEQALDVAQEQIGADFRGVSALYPEWLITPGRLRLRKAVAALDAEVARLVASYRQRPSERENLLSRLMDARDEDGAPLPDREVRDEAITFYVAGHATTAATLTWAYYLLSRNPETYEAMQAEVAEALGGRTPTHEDCARLPYTEQVVKETLRLYPPSWSLAHIAKDGATVGGRAVEKGTLVFTSPWATQRDRRWYHRPEEFRPERWAPGGETAGLPDHAWFPFGGGPRICPGARYATVKTMLVLAVVAQRFRLDVTPWENPPYPGLTAYPRDPMQAFLREVR
ncbi:cytochrome P450 [Streptomyces sp. ODS05-4]|uniref:cytochrome P450 n=1 Tax=Streptomyces sp. ODS05-4 TaxID=2944939 RepID=UPI00210D0C10|nr:cytochrome P450 [Streptomyces sp. ODS05-4]